MSLSSKFSETLLVSRKRSKLTQEESARKIGISRSYYSDIETGKSKPSFETIEKINDLFPIFFITNDANSESCVDKGVK